MRCPNCGYQPAPEPNSYQQEWYARQMAGAQNAWAQGMYGNQMSQGLMQNQYHNPTQTPSIAQPTEPKPEPKPTAWSQFKAMIRQMVP